MAGVAMAARPSTSYSTLAGLAGVGGVYGGPSPRIQQAKTGEQYKAESDAEIARASAYNQMYRANDANRARQTAAAQPAPTGGGAPAPAPINVGGGPAPVVEPKPTANPASMQGLDAALSGGGSGSEGPGMVGTLPNSLRALGRRTFPQESMALAGAQGGIY